MCKNLWPDQAQGGKAVFLGQIREGKTEECPDNKN